jgi:hypothetical protein
MDRQKRKSNNMSAFARFEHLLRGLVSVPKKEVEAEQARWRANRRLKKKSAKT